MCESKDIIEAVESTAESTTGASGVVATMAPVGLLGLRAFRVGCRLDGPRSFKGTEGLGLPSWHEPSMRDSGGERAAGWLSSVLFQVDRGSLFGSWAIGTRIL